MIFQDGLWIKWRWLPQYLYHFLIIVGWTVVANFSSAYKCSQLLHSTENLQQWTFGLADPCIKSIFLWSQSHPVMSNSLWPHGLYNSWNSPGQNTRVCSCSLLQGIFPTQRSNPGLPHCRRILYQLGHQGSPRILEWVAYSFSRRSSWPRNWSGSSVLPGGFFTSWATKKALIYLPEGWTNDQVLIVAILKKC